MKINDKASPCNLWRKSHAIAESLEHPKRSTRWQD
jgi:hypothetical protein